MALIIALLALTASAIQFEKPRFEAADKSSPVTVSITGNTQPSTLVKVPVDKVSTYLKGEYLELDRTQFFPEETLATADATGSFTFSFQSLPSKLQLPLVLQFPDGTEKKIQLNIKVLNPNLTAAEAKAAEPEEQLPDPTYLPIGSTYSIVAGLGFNYLRMQQKTDDGNINLNFQSAELPTQYLATRIKLTERTQMKFSYSSAPGRVATDAKFKFDHKYNWDIFAAETTIFLKERKVSFLRYPLFIGTNFGLQQHVMPYLIQDSPTFLKLHNSSILMAFWGANLMQKIEPWIFEIYFRIQFPIVTGKVFTPSNVLAMDGAFRAEYKFNPSWSFATYWYGQYHNYKSTHKDPLSNRDVPGSLLLFFSTLEARVVYNF